MPSPKKDSVKTPINQAVQETLNSICVDLGGGYSSKAQINACMAAVKDCGSLLAKSASYSNGGWGAEDEDMGAAKACVDKKLSTLVMRKGLPR